MLRKLDAALMTVEMWTARLGGAVILLIMLLMTAEVLLRKLVNNPIPGQLDMVSVSMVAFSVLCISYCYRQAGHIRMDLLQKALTGRAQHVTNLVATLLALFTVVAIGPGTWLHFLRAYEFGDTTIGVAIPTWPSKLAVTVGLGILALRLALEIWVFGRLVVSPSAEPVGVPKAPDPRTEKDA